MKDRSLKFFHEMRKADTGEVAATTTLTGVHLDKAARARLRVSAKREGQGRRDARLVVFALTVSIPPLLTTGRQVNEHDATC